LRFRVAAADLGFEGAAGGVEQLGQGAIAGRFPGLALGVSSTAWKWLLIKQ